MDKLHKIEQILHRSGLDITLGDDALFFTPEDNIEELLLDLDKLDDEFWKALGNVVVIVFDLNTLTFLDQPLLFVLTNNSSMNLKDKVVLIGQLTYMQARLLLDLMPNKQFNPILMWHMYSYHEYDKVIRCRNSSTYVDFFQIEVMVKNNIKENYSVKLLSFSSNTSLIFVQNPANFEEIK